MIEMLNVPSISRLKAKSERALGLQEAARKRLELVRAEIKELENEETLLGMVNELFRQLIDAEITEGVQAVEALQTEGLQTVFFDQDISARAEVEVQRGKVSVELLTVQKREDGTVVEGLSKDGFGGSILTLQSVLMRVITILRRDMRRIVIMDESLPAFDDNYVTYMGKFLNVVCERLGIDLFLVTHNPVLVECADKGYRIVRRGNDVKFERLRG